MTRQQIAQNSQVNGSVGDGDHPTPQGTPQQGRQFLHTRSSSLSAMQVCRVLSSLHTHSFI